jgi:hypothetical protein
MDVVFIILKIIGLILAVLLGMLLLFCILALTVPVRYLVDAKKETEETFVKIRVSWLLRMLTVTFEYNGEESDIKIRLLGIRLLKLDTKQESDEADELTEILKNKKPSKSKEPPKTDKEPVSIKKSEESPKTTVSSKSETTSKTMSFPKPSDSKKPKAKKKWKNKLSRMWTSFQKRWKEFKKAYKEAKERIKWFFHFINNKENKAVWKAVKKEIIRLLKHIKPKTIRAKIKFGLEDPCNTGLALGLTSLIYAYLDGFFQVEPDFENKVFEGFIYAKGRIYLLVVLMMGIRLYRNRSVRRMVKELLSQI